jgi:hypothetical protein
MALRLVVVFEPATAMALRLAVVSDLTFALLREAWRCLRWRPRTSTLLREAYQGVYCHRALAFATDDHRVDVELD